MEEGSLTDIVKKMGKIIEDFTCLGTNLSSDLGKLSEASKKFSGKLSSDESFEFFSVCQKIGTEDVESFRELTKKGDKEKLTLLIKKYTDNQNIINLICDSMDMWTETMNLEDNLTSKVAEIFKNTKLTDDLTEIGKSFMNSNLDSTNVKDLFGKISEKLGIETEVPDLKVTVDKVINDEEANKIIIESLTNITEKISNKFPTVRKGLVDESFKMIEHHKKLSDDINSVVKSLNSSEIQLLKEKCGGELPLEFRLRMMENTIHHLDKTLSGDQKTDMEELTEKIDDIAINLEVLVSKLSKILQ